MDKIEIQMIEAERDKKLELDTGFFVITLDPARHKIIMEYYEGIRDKRERIISGKPVCIIEGDDATSIYQIAARMKLFGRYEHAAHVGHELGNAEIALKAGLDYVQDELLKIRKFED